jgi:hypothetical protein
LLKRCESILDSARERIELITLRNDSTESPAKTGTQAGAPSQSESPDATDDDDIRLF